MSSQPDRIARRVLCVWLATAALATPASSDIPQLTFVRSVPIHDEENGLTEPSGLSTNAASGGFWMVSDDSRRILATDRDGHVVSATDRHKALDDLEGVAEDRANGRLLAVSESRTSVVSLPLEGGDEHETHHLKDVSGFEAVSAAFAGGDGNDGLEGISLDATSGSVYVIRERAPRLLLELSSDLSSLLHVKVLGAAEGFVSPEISDDRLDISGVAVDPQREAFWLLSDADEAVYLVPRAAGPFIRYALLWDHDGETRRISNPEGIALSADGRSLFVISDDGRDSGLFEYRVED